MNDPVLEQLLKRIEARLDSIESEIRSLKRDDLFIRAREASRARVTAAGLTDADIDALIEEAREDIARKPA